MTQSNEVTKYFNEIVLTYEDKIACLTWPYAKHLKQGYGHYDGTSVAKRICEKLYGPAPTLLHVAAHSCGNGHLACCNRHHVRWATRKENANDLILHGGRHGPSPIVSSEDALEMKRLKESGWTFKELRDYFKVGSSTVSRSIDRISR